MLCQRPYLLQKQHKNYYILYTLLLFTNHNKQRYGKAEQQSFRAAEVCTRSPLDEVPLQSCSRPPLDEALLHSCSMPPSDEALLHSCSMPPFGRGPSTLLLHALYWTRPILQELFLLQIKPSAEPTTLHADKDIANRQLSPINIWNSATTARTLTPSKFCYYLI